MTLNNANSGTTLATGGGTFFTDVATTLTYGPASPAIVGPGALIKDGAGTLWLNKACTYVGDTMITSGTLKQGTLNVIPFGNNAGNVTVAAGATFDMGSFVASVNGLSGAGTVDNIVGTPVTLVTIQIGNKNATSVFNGVIQNTVGTNQLFKTGTGTLTLGGVNTYSGATFLNTGTLKMGVVNSLPAAGQVRVTSPGTLDLAGFSQNINDLNGTGIVNNSGAAATLTVNATVAGGDLFSGTIKNTGLALALTMHGPTTLKLSGVNTYTAATTVKAVGTLQLGNIAAIPSGPGTGATTNDGTLDLNGFSPTLNALNGVNGLVDNTAAGTTTFSVGADNRSAAFNGVILNTGGHLALIKVGTGIQTVGGMNIYNGDTTVNAGTLQYGAGVPAAIPAGLVYGNVHLNSPGILDLNGNSPTINGLFGNGTVDNLAAGAATLTIGDADVTSTFAGPIQNSAGPVSLIKTGLGTLSLTAASAYHGGTTVSNGVLTANNVAGSATGTGPVMVLGGATISGSGFIQGDVSINTTSNSPGLLSPGTLALPGTVGTLHLAGNLTMNNATLLFDVSVSSNDLVVVTGNLNALQCKLNINPVAGFGPGTNTLFTYGGNLTLPTNGIVIGTAPGNYVYRILTNTPGVVKLVIAKPRPTLTHPLLTGNSLVLGGTGGPVNTGGTNGTYYYYVLTSTNLLLPLSQWSTLATNPFAADGSFNFTNLINFNVPQQFFILEVP
jgi:autotransporter-associated beta strand protein